MKEESKSYLDLRSEECWISGPLLEVHVRFERHEVSRLEKEDSERLLRLLSIDGAYVNCGSVGQESRRSPQWVLDACSLGIWTIGEHELGVKLFPALTGRMDILFAVPPRMLESIGIRNFPWSIKSRWANQAVLELHVRLIEHLRHLHTEFPLCEALIQEEGWTCSLGNKHPGIYVGEEIARVGQLHGHKQKPLFRVPL